MVKPIIYWHPFSAPCRGTWLAAKNLNIDVDFRQLDLITKEHHRPEFVKINPMHCVPTLDDDGFIIWESRAISTYLAESKTTETSFYPKNDPKKRAVIDSLLYFDATYIYERVRKITRPILYDGATSIKDENVKQVFEAYDDLEQYLAKNEFVAGKVLTLADFHMLATVETTKQFGMGFEKHQKIAAWYERCRKCVKGFDEHVGFTKAYVDLVKSMLQK